MASNRNLFGVSARDVMNYAYCPRIVYFERVLRAPQATTVKEVAGREKHAEQSRLEKRRESRRHFVWTRKLREVHLESESLGCTTVLDLLLIDDNAGEAVPMQFKNSVSPPVLYRGQKLQILLESVLAEEKFGINVPYGLVKFLQDSRIFRVETGGEDKQRLCESLKEIRMIVESEAMPEPTACERRCVDCCFKRRCLRV